MVERMDVDDVTVDHGLTIRWSIERADIPPTERTP
jgi:hypothetical protein